MSNKQLAELWVCDVCGSRHHTAQHIERCKKIGIPPMLPVGLVFMFKDDPNLYAIAHQHRNSPETYDPGLWVIRAGSDGHTLPSDNSFIGDIPFSEDNIIPPPIDNPLFYQMVMEVLEAGIQLFIWDGEHPTEFIKVYNMPPERFLMDYEQ